MVKIIAILFAFIFVFQVIEAGNVSRTAIAPCIFDSKCDEICRSEGSTGGHCSYMTCWCDLAIDSAQTPEPRSERVPI